MIRGGSWNNDARNARSANRNRNKPENRNNNLGFRLARAQPWGGFPFGLARPLTGPVDLLGGQNENVSRLVLVADRERSRRLCCARGAVELPHAGSIRDNGPLPKILSPLDV